jgi:O-succinylbenzoate synthase
VEKVRKAIDLRSCRWINIKLGRVGGLTNALTIHDLCREGGVACWVGGMLESAIGQAHNIAFATLSNINYPSDIFPTNRFYHEDLAEPEVVLSGPSQMKVTEKPGIGYEPNAKRLLELLINKATIK